MIVSLRDEFQIISEGNTLIDNCQLSIVNFKFPVCHINREEF